MDRNALYGCEMVLSSSLLALGIYWVFLEDAGLASLRLKARESDRMLLSVGRRGSKERAGNSGQHVQSSGGSGRYPTRSPDHRLYSPGEGWLFPLQAGRLNALPRSRVFLRSLYSSTHALVYGSPFSVYSILPNLQGLARRRQDC